jgi:hypothetical protein
MNWNLPNPHLRKTRSNAGKKRGPRKAKAVLVSPGSLLGLAGMKIRKGRKTRARVVRSGEAESTGFLNTKRRVIYKSGAGKYFAESATGSKVYNPKAKYHKSVGGTERATKYLRSIVSIPSPIRPKFNRKERKNIGAKRSPYAARVRGVRVLPVKRKAYITEMFEGHPVKRGRGRPRKASIGSLLGLAGMKIVGQRRTRSNKGKARGPYGPRKSKA